MESIHRWLIDQVRPGRMENLKDLRGAPTGALGKGHVSLRTENITFKVHSRLNGWRLEVRFPPQAQGPGIRR